MQISDLYRTLTPALAERTRVLGGPPQIASEGQYVLYWMHTAIREDENPALQVSIELANQLRLPVLVYQGLSERYPYASDRHHTFVLQGARDVQHALSNKNIAYALHIERPGHRGPHLKTLAQRAALVVSEDMPVEPLRSWSILLSRGIQSPFIVVDTACVVPMQLIGQSYERAFEFRNATKRLYAERVEIKAADSQPKTSFPSEMDLPFESVNLQDTDISSLVCQCEIDHSIGPVPHSIGGSAAGYTRWQSFRDKGLSTYDRKRNNALVDGVSRMSPYLHYGMVAPTRIARETVAEQSVGAEKFVDELLIWRELSYAFCYYRRDHGRIAAIPSWARKTLGQHEADPRQLLSWETMARGQTGDSIWDSAQRSLLIHGELHNNVRMTWGKAMLYWTPDAKQALARIIDLNHRYALDGRDPASYGGILWCLGQFDRPFSPAQPILGTVRTRSTAQHSKRLDPIAYRRKVTRTFRDPMPRVAVVGAGISGLMCARTLVDHGYDVSLLEKSCGVSGRMATRKVDDNLRFDHGAQYFTARDDRFKRYVHSWLHDGLVQLWNGHIVVVENGVVKAVKKGDKRYVGFPDMRSIGKHLAKDLSIRFETHVSAVQRSDDKWLLANANGIQLGHFDIVVVAVPSHQAAALLSDARKLADQTRAVKMNGCWALMLAFEEPLNLGFDGAFVHGSPLSWVARNSSKSGREGDSEAWTVHASAEWSEARIECSSEEIKPMLMEAFRNAMGVDGLDPIHSSVHRWRYAIPKEPLTSKCLFDDRTGIGACGDWCGGPRVEGAFLSGMAMAGRIMGRDNQISVPTHAQQLDLF